MRPKGTPQEPEARRRRAVAMIERGEISDAKTVAGVLLTARRIAAGDRAPR